MIEYFDVVYEGFHCLQIKNQQLSIWMTKDCGPRVIGLALAEGENLMVVLPEARIPVENGEDYSLRGGHRLWYAPEKPETTYLPDDTPVEINRIPGGAEVIQTPDQPTGIQKSWKMILDENGPEVVIEHQLKNTGNESFLLAPWAVTMLRPGGLGVIPLQQDLSDPHGLWPNRQIVIWPYTDLSSPWLEIRNQAIRVVANLREGALKIGLPNPRGWVAYALDGLLFVKKVDYDPAAEYLDRRASSQIYTNPTVIELETLGPVVDLLPGKSTFHRETWQVYQDGQWPEEISSLFKL